jgi:hypothetical protein
MKRFFTYLKIFVSAVVVMGNVTIANAQINWGQIGADIDGAAVAGDNFGSALSMSGDGAVVAVGAYADASNQIGSVSVYENQSGTWVQKGQTLVGLTSSRFGRSVALNATGSVLVAGGATWSSNRGFVRVYEYSGGNWVQIGADITGDASNHRTGWSVAINDAGTRIAIGENLFDEVATDVGRVRVFDNVSGVWTLAGAIVGEAAGDQFGQSVCLDASGNILAVGASFKDGIGADAGNAYVFDISGAIWNEIGDIGGDAAGDDQFGWDVSLNAAGSRLAVSAPNAGTPYVKVYEFAGGTTWDLLGGATDIVGVSGENTGRYSLDLNAAGDVVAVGGEGFTGGGRARVFEYNGTNWNLIAAQVLSEAAGDLWGYSIAISDDGSVFAASAVANDGAATNAGHVRVYEQSDIWTWKGYLSNSWTTARNWDGNQVPVAGSKVIIPSGLTNYPTLEAAAPAFTDLTINSNATGTGSIIGQSNLTVNGVTTVNRYMSGNAWHLVTATAAGQDITSFLADHSNIPTNGASRGMMDYNEGTNNWNTFFTNAQAGSLDAGKGFSVRTSADGEVAFTGTLQGGNLNVPVTTTGQGWNNVGNPYPSAIKMNSASGLINNFITVNDANFDPNYKAVYVWEQGNSAYTIVNNASGAYTAALGQAFMVKANTGVTQMSFTTGMQTHEPAAVLKSGMESSPSIKLVATLGGSQTSTIIKFDDNMSEGLDAGYDAGMFKTGFDLYTRLVKDNGVDFGIQCLPTSVFNNGEIVLGLQSTKSGAVSFSAETENLPLGTRIVLEDRLNQTLTELKAGEVYTTQVEKGEAARGRFYLRTSLGVTGLDEVGDKSAFRIYQADSRIYISGIVEGKADATLYDLMGRTVKSVRLENSVLNSIESSGLTNGVYMVKINHARGIFSQKVLVNNQ